jgi:hypothetical protein
MPRQRPASSVVGRTGAVARLPVVTAVVTALVTALAGCDAGSVSVEPTDPRGADAAACSRLLDALPETVSDQPRRAVEPEDAYAAAWGEPAIVLRCGVPMPANFDRAATCQEANGVGWFVPQEQIDDQQADVVMTTIGRAQNVEVVVPGSYRPPAATMVDLAEAVKQTIDELEPCA